MEYFRIKGNYYIIFWSIYFSHITIEELVDFYFCAKPEHFIWDFLPKYPKWQLLEKSVTTTEFQNRVFLLSHNFFFYFNSIFPEYSILNAEKRCSIKIYKKNQNNKILCKIMGLQRKKNKFERDGAYLEDLNCKCMVIDKEDYKEIKCIFNKRGKYMLMINGNDGSSNSYKNIAQIFIQCNRGLTNQEFDFLPEDYKERSLMKKGNQIDPCNCFFVFIPFDMYNEG